MWQAVPDPVPALGSNCQEFPGGCLGRQFAADEVVAQVHRDGLGQGVQHLCHLPPGQPDGLVVETDINPNLAVAAFLNRNLTTGTGFLRFPVHPVVRPGSTHRLASVERILQRLARPERHRVRRADRDRPADARVPTLSGGPALPGEPPETGDRDVVVAHRQTSARPYCHRREGTIASTADPSPTERAILRTPQPFTCAGTSQFHCHLHHTGSYGQEGRSRREMGGDWMSAAGWHLPPNPIPADRDGS